MLSEVNLEEISCSFSHSPTDCLKHGVSTSAYVIIYVYCTSFGNLLNMRLDVRIRYLVFNSSGVEY